MAFPAFPLFSPHVDPTPLRRDKLNSIQSLSTFIILSSTVVRSSDYIHCPKENDAVVLLFPRLTISSVTASFTNPSLTRDDNALDQQMTDVDRKWKKQSTIGDLYELLQTISIQEKRGYG